MYGVYAWNAGAAAASVQADLVRWITGGDIAGMSSACNKPASSQTGLTDWSAIDAAFGVVGHAGDASGPGVKARVTVSGASKVQLAVVDGWDVGTHTAAYAAPATDVSLSLASAGSVSLVAGDGVLVIGSSDWSVWCIAAEVTRGAPGLAGAATVSGAVLLSASGIPYMARVKTPGSAGDTAAAYVQVQSAYGALSTAAARDRSESLYLPGAPATVSYGQVPVGELIGVKIVGGYALSGDSVIDESSVEYLVAKTGATGYAVIKA